MLGLEVTQSPSGESPMARRILRRHGQWPSIRDDKISLNLFQGNDRTKR